MWVTWGESEGSGRADQSGRLSCTLVLTLVSACWFDLRQAVDKTGVVEHGVDQLGGLWEGCQRGGRQSLRGEHCRPGCRGS